jgi:hypothetical protein
MLSAPAADQVWKAMTRAFPTQERSEQCPAAAGATAYAALLHGPKDAGETVQRPEPWLLLRDHTAARPSGR